MSDKQELLPCPFCGNCAATVYPRTCDKDTPYNPRDRAFPIVRCGKCLAEMPGKAWRGESTAIEAWNRRAMLQAAPPAPAPMAEENQRLRGMLCDVLRALGNGSGASPECSLEFLSSIPEEVRLVVADLRAPPAPVAATGFDREYVRAYLEELLIEKIGNPHADPEVSKFLEWLAAPVAVQPAPVTEKLIEELEFAVLSRVNGLPGSADRLHEAKRAIRDALVLTEKPWPFTNCSGPLTDCDMLDAPDASPSPAPVACPNAAHTGKHACADKSQCWEPCGDLGHRMEHARASPAPVVTDAPSLLQTTVLRDVVRCLRATGRYEDEEGEATDALEALAAVFAAQSGAGTRGEKT